ncbi:CBS domain-containing protein [Ornithinimicrobium pratense]|uniref:CBS domain-containing protein n=1 Tax=Ornithinimicrobium pratense TaxID=2593973 RepID=A0A5J6V5I8_9MICO|nr:CBS domain-containing protein [Ornithinimicrobium pratense]QFG69240.1 CBS domain-containing protein [Ornithinimicrobium pratense]
MSAFNDVEAHLKFMVYGGKDVGSVSFAKLLETFKTKRSRDITQKQYDDLRVLAQVRNSLTHERQFDDQRLAVPTDTAIAAMRHIRDRLLDPPTAITVLRSQRPLVVEPGLSVRAALDLMYENDFSQLPVYDDDTYKGLLTTNTVARWVADQMRQHDGLLEDASIATALSFQENEPVRHVPKSVTSTRAVRTFVEAAERGSPLAALIVTETGKSHQRPVAVVTPADIPKLTDS